MKNVGDRIKAFRELRSLTQKEVYRATGGDDGGIKQTTLSAIENGQAKPGFDTLTAFMAAYPDLNPDWLLLGAGEMLRDGRTLAPSPRPVAAPTPGLTSGAATVAEAENVLLREQLTEQREMILWLRGELGKSPGSADAAGLYVPAAPRPVAGFRPAACQLAATSEARREARRERMMA